MRFYLIIFILFFGIFRSQTLKVRILDSENGSAISNARIISLNQILYSNDDGFVLMPEHSKNFEVSAYGYETLKFKEVGKLIKLKPLYKDIDEVKIISINIKEIFEEVFKNYNEKYYTLPSSYDIVYHQKNKTNNIVNFLFIFNGKLWSLSNKYDFKDGLNKKFDNFLQMQIDTVKYYKSKNVIDEFEDGALDKSRDFIGDIFFNYQLSKIIRTFKIKNIKYSGRLLNESTDEQSISYKIDLPEKVEIFGTFIYNKADKTISHLEFNYDQTKLEPFKKKTESGEKYLYKLGNGKIVYDFYKKDNKYFPAAVFTEGSGFKSIFTTKIFENSFERKIIFQNLIKSGQLGLPKKIDLSKRIWDNISKQKKDDNSMLLSEEEQIFIDEK